MQRNKNGKLETDIFSSDTDCMGSKIKEAIHANKIGNLAIYICLKHIHVYLIVS